MSGGWGGYQLRESKRRTTLQRRALFGTKFEQKIVK